MTDTSAETPATEVLTFGCRLNAYETEAMREMADAVLWLCVGVWRD